MTPDQARRMFRELEIDDLIAKITAAMDRREDAIEAALERSRRRVDRDPNARASSSFRRRWAATSDEELEAIANDCDAAENDAIAHTEGLVRVLRRTGAVPAEPGTADRRHRRT